MPLVSKCSVLGSPDALLCVLWCYYKQLCLSRYLLSNLFFTRHFPIIPDNADLSTFSVDVNISLGKPICMGTEMQYLGRGRGGGICSINSWLMIVQSEHCLRLANKRTLSYKKTVQLRTTIMFCIWRLTCGYIISWKLIKVVMYSLCPSFVKILTLHPSLR